MSTQPQPELKEKCACGVLVLKKNLKGHLETKKHKLALGLEVSPPQKKKSPEPHEVSSGPNGEGKTLVIPANGDLQDVLSLARELRVKISEFFSTYFETDPIIEQQTPSEELSRAMDEFEEYSEELQDMLAEELGDEMESDEDNEAESEEDEPKELRSKGPPKKAPKSRGGQAKLETPLPIPISKLNKLK